MVAKVRFRGPTGVTRVSQMCTNIVIRRRRQTQTFKQNRVMLHVPIFVPCDRTEYSKMRNGMAGGLVRDSESGAAHQY